MPELVGRIVSGWTSGDEPNAEMIFHPLVVVPAVSFLDLADATKIVALNARCVLGKCVCREMHVVVGFELSW